MTHIEIRVTGGRRLRLERLRQVNYPLDYQQLRLSIQLFRGRISHMLALLHYGRAQLLLYWMEWFTWQPHKKILVNI